MEPPIQISPDHAPPPWPTTSPQPTEPRNVQGVLSKHTHLDVQSPTISISSVDDVVPQPKSSSPLPISVRSQSSIPVTIGGVGDITTGMAGSTTSRFTLRLPLLGRPKIPLNQAVAVAQTEDIRNSTPVTPVASDTTTHLTVDTTEGVQRPDVSTVSSNTSALKAGLLSWILTLIFSSDVLSEQVDQSRSVGVTTLEDISKAVEELVTEQSTSETREDSQAQATATPQPGSWWGYVGWGGAQPGEAALPPSMSVDVAPSMEHAESAGTEFLSAVSTESPVFLSNTQSPLVSPLPPPTQDSDKGDTSKPASIASSEGPSSWLTPWNWYPSTGSTPPPPRPPLPPVEEESERSLTESQLVREAALARDAQPTLVATQSPAPASDTGGVTDTMREDKVYADEVNPIRSTIGANRSGWTSFFMARSVKSITEDGEKKPIGNEHGNNEMEVMEVPGPEDLPPGVTVTATTTTAAPANFAPASSNTNTVAAMMNQFVSKSSAPSIKSSSSKVPGSPAQPLKEIEREQARGEKEPKKKEPPAPPLTNSDDVKKETARKVSERPSSPSPSKRSGTPRPMSPPNLVLPTWGDTFHAPPRSLLPISMMHKGDEGAEYVVTKAIKSLWSKGWEVAGMGSAKGKERAGTRRASGEAGPSDLGDFGKTLPRALNVVGDQIDPKLLQGACRIVVIGVAGWSPGAVTRKIAGGVSFSFRCACSLLLLINYSIPHRPECSFHLLARSS